MTRFFNIITYMILAMWISSPLLANTTEKRDSIYHPMKLCGPQPGINPKNPDPYLLLPGYGLFAQKRPGHYIGLDSVRYGDIKEFIMRSGTVRFNQIWADADRLIGKAGKEIYLLTEESLIKVADMPSSAFRFADCFNKGAIAILYHRDGSEVYCIPYDSSDPLTLIARSENLIPQAVNISDNTFMVADAETLWVVEGENASPFLSFPDPIIDFTITDRGIIVVLPTEVLKISDNSECRLFEGCMKKVYHDNNRLYFIAPEGSVFYIDLN